MAQNVGNVAGANRARTGTYTARLNAGAVPRSPWGP